MLQAATSTYVQTACRNDVKTALKWSVSDYGNCRVFAVYVLDRSRLCITRMWANAQRDGRPAEYRWRRLFKAAKFG